MLSLLVLPVACSTPGRQECLQTGRHLHKGREYLLVRPSPLPVDAPLLVVLHGYGGDAAWMLENLGWEELAEGERFVACFPDGTVDQHGRRFWNVGYRMHEHSEVDDVSYLVGLAAHLRSELDLDFDSVFVTGFSNGGDMCYVLGCRAPGTFRAIGPVCGTMMDSLYFESSPDCDLSVIAVNGREDLITLFDGDPENRHGWGSYRSVPEVIDFWTANEECTGSRELVKAETDTIGPIDDPLHITRHRHWSEDRRREIQSIVLHGGGHQWPTASESGLDATSSIWKFFSRTR